MIDRTTLCSARLSLATRLVASAPFAHRHRVVTLHCRRLAKASFAVERVERKNEERYILIP